MDASRVTDTSSPGLVYLHGAGLDTWIWDEHAAHLDCPTLAASFPGRGADSPSTSGRPLDDYVGHVVRQVEEWPVDEVVVVAHSIGGVVGVEVAAAIPERVAGFVGVCAAIPRPGGSFFSCLPLPQRALQWLLTRVVGTRPPASAIRESLCAGLSEAQTERVVEGYVAESRRLYTDRAAAGAPDVSTLYVETTDDPAFGPSVQERMIENLAADATEALATGHMPMLGDPSGLAAVLQRFVETATAEH